MPFVTPRYDHLLPECKQKYALCEAKGECDKAARFDAQDGRWYITMGHPGFNSAANNFNGYATQKQAMAAYRRHRRPR